MKNIPVQEYEVTDHQQTNPSNIVMPKRCASIALTSRPLGSSWATKLDVAAAPGTHNKAG